MSLRWFHFLFILVAIVSADLFGAWAIWHHTQTQDMLALVAGVLSFVVSFGLIGYTILLVRKLDNAKIV